MKCTFFYTWGSLVFLDPLSSLRDSRSEHSFEYSRRFEIEDLRIAAIQFEDVCFVPYPLTTRRTLHDGREVLVQGIDFFAVVFCRIRDPEREPDVRTIRDPFVREIIAESTVDVDVSFVRDRTEVQGNGARHPYGGRDVDVRRGVRTEVHGFPLTEVRGTDHEIDTSDSSNGVERVRVSTEHRPYHPVDVEPRIQPERAREFREIEIRGVHFVDEGPTHIDRRTTERETGRDDGSRGRSRDTTEIP